MNQVIGQQKAAPLPSIAVTGKVASRHRRSQMASKSTAEGRNTALYQRLSCLPTQRRRERGESTSMRADRARVDDSEVQSVPSSSVRRTVTTKGNTKIRLCSRLCWKLSCAPTLLEMFCSVCGGGGGFPTSAAYSTYGKGWKRPL